MNNELALKDKLWVEDLVSNRIPEGRKLDYKQALPDNSPASEIEFLNDVVAFGNASGGDLLFGVEEEVVDGKRTGLPRGYADLKIRSADETIRRLQRLIRRGIEPVLPVQIDMIEDLPQGLVIRVSVPASWTAPHMVTLFRRDLLKPQFYKRHNTENVPMDIDEIRTAFALSESRVERLRRFRDGRISQIVSGAFGTPHVQTTAPKLILHLLPINAADSAAAINIKQIQRKGLDKFLTYTSVPAPWKATTQSFNFDGFLVEIYNTHASQTKPVQYAQVFRNGGIETVKTLPNESYIGKEFESSTLNYLKHLVTLVQELDTPLPIAIMPTLWGANGLPYMFPNNNGPMSHGPNNIDRDVLILPECLLEDWGALLPDVLHPAFDTLYQDVGSPGSLSYDDQGKWIGTGS